MTFDLDPCLVTTQVFEHLKHSKLKSQIYHMLEVEEILVQDKSVPIQKIGIEKTYCKKMTKKVRSTVFLPKRLNNQ